MTATGYQQEQAQGFVAHSHEKTFAVNQSRGDVWDILLQKKTFTDHQVWPFRVEFMGTDSPYMQTGEENIHHGPWLLFTGAMGEIAPPSYRELNYFYGSYFLSFRWIRPSRLQIWVDPAESGSSIIKVRIDSWVKPWASGMWTFMQNIFWSGFGRWINGLVKRSKKS